MTAVAQLAAVTLDCPDPQALAEFYRQVTGWELVYGDESAAYLAGEAAAKLGFQRVDKYRAPMWPDGAPQQLHLDFNVADLDAAEEQLLKLGATKAEAQPGGDQWRVFLDPVGHPFCITPGE